MSTGYHGSNGHEGGGEQSNVPPHWDFFVRSHQDVQLICILEVDAFSSWALVPCSDLDDSRLDRGPSKEAGPGES